MRTGKLRDSTTVAPLVRGELITGAVIKNTAKYARIFEHGTQVRHTALGANRGAMPPGGSSSRASFGRDGW